MRLGDRATTPKGQGTIVGFEEFQGWRRVGVALDTPLWHGNPAWFYPADNVTTVKED